MQQSRPTLSLPLLHPTVGRPVCALQRPSAPLELPATSSAKPWAVRWIDNPHLAAQSSGHRRIAWALRAGMGGGAAARALQQANGTLAAAPVAVAVAALPGAQAAEQPSVVPTAAGDGIT